MTRTVSIRPRAPRHAGPACIPVIFLTGMLLLFGAISTGGPPGQDESQTAPAFAAGQVPGPAEAPPSGPVLDGPAARTGEGSSNLADVPRAGLRLATGDQGRRLSGHQSLVFKPPRSAI